MLQWLILLYTYLHINNECSQQTKSKAEILRCAALLCSALIASILNLRMYMLRINLILNNHLFFSFYSSSLYAYKIVV